MKTNEETVLAAIEKALEPVWYELMKDRMCGDIAPDDVIHIGQLQDGMATIMLEVRELNEAKCMDSVCGHGLSLHMHTGECEVKGCQCKGMTDYGKPLTLEFDALMGRGRGQNGLQD